MFQAKKWGWKRLAANLLLIPVLTGGSAAVAHAQYGTGPASPLGGSPGAPPAMGAKPSANAMAEAKALLKDGRQALAAGRFDRAQDLARAAEATYAGGKWGLFDDTPGALLKDVQAAVVKSQKAQADQMMKQARALVAKPAPTEVEKAANLDQAYQLAQRVEQLHGPYSAWDVGDRPEKLLREIQLSLIHI